MTFPATTKGGGICFVFPDVCKVPAPPGPPTPTPFPNIGMCAAADASTTTQRVKILNQPAFHLNTRIPRTMGDEPGVAKGVITPFQGDQAQPAEGSTVVMLEGNPAVMHLKMFRHNGISANAPPGANIAPSQATVFIGK